MQDKLIEGKEYHLWNNGKYLGIGVFCKDELSNGVIYYCFDLFDECYFNFQIDQYQQASELLTTK